MIRFLFMAAILVAVSPNRLRAEAAVDYPPSKTVDATDDYHGTAVADPYRWLEKVDSAETAAWIESQNAVTLKYLDSLPMRAALRKRITELWNYPKVGVPRLEGGRFWYRKNSGLQRQAVVYVKSKIDAPPVVALDPNAISPNGSVSLAQIAPSPDGRFLAYSISQGGMDWETILVRELATNRDLGDAVEWTRYSRIAWTHDSKGFFYSRYPAPSDEKLPQSPLGIHSLYYHRLGTPQSADPLIYEQTQQPGWFVRGNVSQDGRYLSIRVSQGSARRNRLYYMDLENPRHPNLEARIDPLIGTGEALYRLVGNVGSKFFLLTDAAAPRARVVVVDVKNPDHSTVKTVIPQGSQVIQNAVLVGGRLVVQYLVDVKSKAKFYTLAGKELGTLGLPGIGTIRDLTGRYDSPELFYSFTAPLQPSTVFVCRRICRTGLPFEAASPPFDRRAYETKQLFAISKDGARVPYFLTARRNLKHDRNNPVVLYGYGGFSNSITPRYRPDVPAWLELGGIFVTTNVRGGGAYGEDWHRAGMMEKKQNSFNDFIAVAEDLIRRGYTSPARLAIQGSSNGGLLVAAAMNQRPDLFAAAVPTVGVMDMLRYQQFTAGAAWVTEYGVATDAKMFPVLIKYSPLHNLQLGICYPATLVMTADRDDRVVPSHSFKYIAALQRSQGCAHPVLLRVEKGGSHNYRATDRLIEEMADAWAFVAAQTGVKVGRELTGIGRP